MIDAFINYPPTKNDILDGLKKLNQVYPSGSRYFASRDDGVITIDEKTDYDFYTYNESLMINGIKDLGFIKRFDNKIVADRYKGDDWLIAIYKHHEYNIEILIRENVSIYKRLQEKISSEFYRDYLWKSGPNKPSRKQIQDTYNQMFKLMLP